ncbi:MAG: geranylgeranylglycerol-phosphate geranylgeranyltransferase [Desulfurococcaceae archaeon TW002]
MNSKTKLKAYLELLRVHNVVTALLTTLIGWLTIRIEVSTLTHTSLIIPLLAVSLVSSAGYVINDYFDIEVDKVNKPYRPIPSGRVSPREALYLTLVLVIVGVAPSLTVGPYTAAFVLINTLLVILYSYKIKELGFVGNVVVSLEGAFTIVLGALTPSEILNDLSLIRFSLIPATYAFTLLLAREIIKTIEDMRADEVRNVRSLPRIIGVSKSSIIAFTLQLFIVCISFIPFLVGYSYLYLVLALVTDALLIYSVINTIKLGRVSNPELLASKLRGILKLAIFTGTTAFATDLLYRLFFL